MVPIHPMASTSLTKVVLDQLDAIQGRLCLVVWLDSAGRSLLLASLDTRQDSMGAASAGYVESEVGFQRMEILPSVGMGLSLLKRLW